MAQESLDIEAQLKQIVSRPKPSLDTNLGIIETLKSFITFAFTTYVLYIFLLA